MFAVLFNLSVRLGRYAELLAQRYRFSGVQPSVEAQLGQGLRLQSVVCETKKADGSADISCSTFSVLSTGFANSHLGSHYSLGSGPRLPAPVDEPDLAMRFGAAPVPVTLSLSISEETGLLMRTSMSKAKPTTAFSLTAGQQQASLNLSRARLRQICNARLLNDIAHMSLEYLFRRSMHSSADVGTRLRVPLPASAWTTQEQKGVCAADDELEVVIKDDTGLRSRDARS
ncbi:hypothetical protein FRC07_001095 [Ceratobasidium sp. 392]|nr:hypothetical protein FRC07_001095 [Ceratobasidium sp. 392]